MVFLSANTALHTPSPCIGVCLLDEQERCTGCGRTMTEICAWPLANEAARRTIVTAAAARLATIAEAVDPPETQA